MSGPHSALLEHFGFSAFRPGQEEAVRAALDDRDVLVVMPTGAGKSLCYQLPALMREDLTLVVSPLVSLMQDQVQALSRRAPGRVALVSGQQPAAVNERAVAAAVAGDVRVLYVAPERFSSPGFARALEPADVGLFVVDEAHCVSQWGHDFRPDYFRLGGAARFLGARAVVASTATATPQVAADVVARLGLRDPIRVATGFDRPNLSWTVAPSGDREAQLVAALSAPEALPAIIYAGTRREVDRLAEVLPEALGRPVLAYHAGLERAARAAAQDRFMDGSVDVVVATNAFGMGVDKADVRTVVHASVPPSVEAYYQEAGRAGRDGKSARAVLLASERDKGLHVHFVKRADVTDEAVALVARQLEVAAGGAPAPVLPGFDAAPAPWFEVAIAELGEPDRVRGIVAALARSGVVQLAPSTVDRVRGRLLTGFDGVARDACRAIAEEAGRARWAQYRAIWDFVEGGTCRREAILRHFGDDAARAAPDAAAASGAPDPSTDAARAAPDAGAASGATDPSAGTARAPRAPSAPGVAGCCDVCDATLLAGLDRPLPAAQADVAALVRELTEALGHVPSRTRLVALLRGERARWIRVDALDGLPGYGTLADLSRARVGAALDALAPDAPGGAAASERVAA